MPIVAATIGLAAIAWWLVYARHGSVVIGAAMYVMFGYVFGHEFWHARIGPLPITLDRVILVGLVAVAVLQWRLGLIRLKPMCGADWLFVALLGILTISAVTAGSPEVADYEHSVWGRLTFSFALSGLLYGIARQATLTRRQWQGVLVAFLLFGTYLAITALLEVAGQWALVFPRYISNPELGIHFGRARGPALNSVSLGIYLTACIACGWILSGRVQRGWQQLAIFCTLPLMVLAVFFTYTRSTWLGFAAGAVVVAVMQIPCQWRIPTFSAAVVGGLLVAPIAWNVVVGLEREGTSSESHHSVDQRQSFAYVSWQIFKDHPILGVGFGRFYDRKLPYLSDRRQQVELESIRSLHHHSTPLSILTETGMVGLAAFVAVLVAWARCAWQLAENRKVEPWMRSIGVLMMAILVNYLCSAMFHDLTLVPPQQWLLLLFAGLTINAWQSASQTVGVGAVMRGDNDDGLVARWAKSTTSMVTPRV